MVKRIVDFVGAYDQSLIQNLNLIIADLTKYHVEAADNVRFLSTLERHFKVKGHRLLSLCIKVTLEISFYQLLNKNRNISSCENCTWARVSSAEPMIKSHLASLVVRNVQEQFGQGCFGLTDSSCSLLDLNSLPHHCS